MDFKDEWLKSAILLNWGMALLSRNHSAEENQDSYESKLLEERPYKGFSDADRAKACFNEGLVRIRNNVNLDARLRLGLIKAYLSSYESTESEEDLQTALRLSQDALGFPIHNNEIIAGILKEQGHVYREMGEVEKACESYEKGLALAFDNPILRRNLEKALEQVKVIV